MRQWKVVDQRTTAPTTTTSAASRTTGWNRSRRKLDSRCREDISFIDESVCIMVPRTFAIIHFQHFESLMSLLPVGYLLISAPNKFLLHGDSACIRVTIYDLRRRDLTPPFQGVTTSSF
jgi:hypothetical protein